jgi:hypothetical protein
MTSIKVKEGFFDVFIMKEHIMMPTKKLVEHNTYNYRTKYRTHIYKLKIVNILNICVLTNQKKLYQKLLRR